MMGNFNVSDQIKGYRPPFWLRNGHVHTIYASKFLSTTPVNFERQRWDTPDDDFIDVDLLRADNKKVLVLGHGLEGSSERPYIQTAARYFFENGWDVIAWNSRSCSGEMNLMPKLYCHGDTSDLDFVVHEATGMNYEKIALVGFSMGGAIILNWLGRQGNQIELPVVAAAAISAPCDIRAASQNLEKGFKKLYGNYFLEKLKEKVKLKAAQFPGLLNTQGIDHIKRWQEFDDRFSAPLNGLEDADAFYKFCSANERMHQIAVPTLILNALDDPILSKQDYPRETISSNKKIHTYFPKYGGHVGFLQYPTSGASHAEQTALQFISPFLD